MKILSSALFTGLATAGQRTVSEGWSAADQGGYSSASCQCEIKCTPDIARETCASDIVAAIDMQFFTAQKEKNV